MRKYGIAILFILVVGVIAAIYQIHRPLPALRQTSLAPAAYRVPGNLNITWPAQGSAAVAVAGIGVMGSSNADQVAPLASVAKLMTAYLTLQKHPLGPYSSGPKVTVTAADVATYRENVAAHNSVAPVAEGEVITERQLLEALLLPSGDNIATLLARWDAGSVSAFVQEMNETARKLGMTHTHYADPAGVDPGTAGSALDQVKIAEADMAIPAFKGIVAQPQATLPVGGVVYNTDYILGHDGIIGIKTGSMSQVGANFVFATEPKVNGKKVLLIGCIMAQHGQQPLMTALHGGAALAAQAAGNLQQMILVKEGAQVGALSSAWGQTAAIAATKGVTAIVWPGLTVAETLETKPLGDSVTANTETGQLVVKAGGQTATVPVRSVGGITRPTAVWKLERGIL